MSPSEIIELVKALKESGVDSFAHGDLNIQFGKTGTFQELNRPNVPHYKPVSLEIPPAIPETEAPHIVQKMKSLFKTSDEELIEQLFPLPKEDEEAS